MSTQVTTSQTDSTARVERGTLPDTPLRAWPGRPLPLGATWDGEGVNFALFSRNATGVELCLFDDINDVIPRAEVESFMARYKAAAGFAKDALNLAPPTIAPGAMVS